MSIQAVIDSAVNIEINRSKLVAQTISRSGRVLSAARNWGNPYRITLTPKPVWRLTDQVVVYPSGNNIPYSGTITVKQMIETIFNYDRVSSYRVLFPGITASGTSANPGLDWITAYTGNYPNVDNILTNVTGNTAGDAATGNRMFITLGGTPPATDTVIVRGGDWIRPTRTSPTGRYPYNVLYDIVVPPTATAITGTVASTDTETSITGVSSTTNLRVGQKITENGVNTGSFGGSTFITRISGTTVYIQSTTANTAGAITFDGSSTEVAIPVHRGILTQTGFTYSGSTIIVGGRAAGMYMFVSKLPTIRYLPGKLVEFVGDFELVEEILGA